MKKSKTFHWLDLAFAVALLIKLFGAGIAYFPVLDDYIQYGSYPLLGLSHVYIKIGTLAIRPLASLLDPAFWGLFWPNMVLALFLIGVLYFFSAVLLDRSLIALGIKITPFLYCVYLLLPLTFEGTYWISASSRIVAGLFFATLAAYFLIKYFTNKKKRFLWIYAVTCLVSFGFYESVIVFSGLLQVLVFGKFIYKDKNLKYLYFLLIPAICVILLLIYYKALASFAPMGSRFLGVSFGSVNTRVVSLFSQLLYIFTAGFLRTTVLGFLDGVSVLGKSPFFGTLLFALVVAVSLFCAWASKKHKIRAKAPVCVPLGLALTFFPLFPNILVEDVWLTYRSIVVCLPGLCVLFAPLIALLFKRRMVRQTIVFLMVFVFSIGCINEVHTYKAVNEMDEALLEKVAVALDEDVLTGKKTAVLVLPHEIAVDQTSYYKDHVKSVFYTDWALTGALRAVTENTNIKLVSPVLSLDGLDVEGKQILYMDETLNITEAQNEQ